MDEEREDCEGCSLMTMHKIKLIAIIIGIGVAIYSLVEALVPEFRMKHPRLSRSVRVGATLSVLAVLVGYLVRLLEFA